MGDGRDSNAKGTVEILCTFHSLMYPRPPKTSDNGYTVVKMVGKEGTKGPDGKSYADMFTAVGYYLPTVSGIDYLLTGEWTKSKFGEQFTVATFEEKVQPTEKGIMAYLSSGAIKGIGKKTAKLIYDKFGDKTLEVLDLTPERLMEVSGIKEKTYTKIMNSYFAMRGARDLIALLAPYGLSANRCVQIYTKFGAKAIKLINKNPYVLSEIAGIGFHTADKIAQSLGIAPDSKDRIAAGVLHVMHEAETGGMLFRSSALPGGNLCLPANIVISKTKELLQNNNIHEREVADVMSKLIEKEALVVRMRKFIYRKTTDECEGQAARSLIEIRNGKTKPVKDIEEGLKIAQNKLNCRLAPEQKEAVITTLSNSLTVVTGGPGTGKTMIQSVILKVLTDQYPKADIVMMAPTGRAARRMTESTGYPATTIHKALGLQVSTGGKETPQAEIDADFVIVDEISMLDIFVAAALFSSIKPGTRVLLVGDTDQLPSVGPGAVLADIINSNCVPVVRLKKVYRQAGASLIAINSAKIRNACTELEEGNDFVLVNSQDFENAASIMEELYIKEVNLNGIDNVVILCPFRKKTESGVDAMNKRLQARINPKRGSSLELTKGDKAIRTNDRVMITKNEEELANGDTGYVTRVFMDDGDVTAEIDFGDGRTYQCTKENIDNIELAYATTIHKSQGSEYKVVITNIMNGHHVMLKRNLIYTSITRARKLVYIVFQPEALEKAVLTEDNSKRASLMQNRLRFYNKMLS